MKKLGLKKTTLSRLNNQSLLEAKGGTEVMPDYSKGPGLCGPQITDRVVCAETAPYRCGGSVDCYQKISDACFTDSDC